MPVVTRDVPGLTRDLLHTRVPGLTRDLLHTRVPGLTRDFLQTAETAGPKKDPGHAP